jgi:hypothetical protein
LLLKLPTQQFMFAVMHSSVCPEFLAMQQQNRTMRYVVSEILAQ